MKKNLSEIPILLPSNPFWAVFKTFSKDEILAMVINVLGTFLIGLWLATGNISAGVTVFLLSIAGPVVEKFGFFPLHFIEARKIYKTTPLSNRKDLKYYRKQAFKDGSKSLLEDVLIHDPFYILFMVVGQAIYPGAPAWILAVVSFIVAVFAVSGLEVAFYELKYVWFKRRQKRKFGAGEEKYYESRFFLDDGFDIEELIAGISGAFNLGNRQVLEYKDTYYETDIPGFNNRTVKLRHRNRTADGGTGIMESVQAAFTRAIEISPHKAESYRFFPQYKEKLFFPLNPTAGDNKPDLMTVLDPFMSMDSKVSTTKGTICKVNFTRTSVNNPVTLYFAVDKITRGEEKFTVCELKVWKDNTQTLLEAMRYVMQHFPVLQTTHTKLDMIETSK